MALLVACLACTLALLASVRPTWADVVYNEDPVEYYQNYFNTRPEAPEGQTMKMPFVAQGYHVIRAYENGGKDAVESASRYAVYKLAVKEHSLVHVDLAVTYEDSLYTPEARDYMVLYRSVLDADGLIRDQPQDYDAISLDRVAGSNRTLSRDVFLSAGTYYIGVYSENTGSPAPNDTDIPADARDGSFSLTWKAVRTLPDSIVSDETAYAVSKNAIDDIAVNGSASGTFAGKDDATVSKGTFAALRIANPDNYGLHRITVNDPMIIDVSAQVRLDSGNAVTSAMEIVMFSEDVKFPIVNGASSERAFSHVANAGVSGRLVFFLKPGTYYLGVRGDVSDGAGSYDLSCRSLGTWSDEDGSSWGTAYYTSAFSLLSPTLKAGADLIARPFASQPDVRIYPFADMSFVRLTGSSAENYTLFKITLDQASSIKINTKALFTGQGKPEVSGSTTNQRGDRFVFIGRPTSSDLSLSFSTLWNEMATISWDGDASSFSRVFNLNKGTYYFGIESSDLHPQAGNIAASYEVLAEYDQTFPKDQDGLDADGKVFDSYALARQVAVGDTIKGMTAGTFGGGSFSQSSSSSGDAADYYWFKVTDPGTYVVKGLGRIILEDAGGQEIGAWGWGSASSQIVNLVAGKYFVRAEGLSASVRGAQPNYEFSVSPVRTHTVTFDVNGGSAIDPVSVASGDLLTAPANPTRAGYSFAGWYSDADLASAYNFSAPVTSDITLYAKWIEVSDNNQYDLAGFRSGADSSTWTHPTKEGQAFAGWFTDESLTSPVSKSTVSGTAYAKFVPVSEVILFRGGGLRISNDDPVEDADMRLGFDFAAPASARIDWDRSGWKYGTAVDNLSFSTSVKNYLSNGGGSYTANIVFINVPIKRFDSSVYTLAHLCYTTQDGTVVELDDTQVRSRTVMGIVSAILDDASESDGVRVYATRLRKAYDDLYSKYH